MSALRQGAGGRTLERPLHAVQKRNLQRIAQQAVIKADCTVRGRGIDKCTQSVATRNGSHCIRGGGGQLDWEDNIRAKPYTTAVSDL